MSGMKRMFTRSSRNSFTNRRIVAPRRAATPATFHARRLRADVFDECIELVEHRHAGLMTRLVRRARYRRPSRESPWSGARSILRTIASQCAPQPTTATVTQIQAGGAHARKHHVRDEPSGNQQAARHRRPVGEPETRHVVEAMQREHQHECARLHDQPGERHLSGKHELRAAAPRLVDAEARKQRERKRGRKRDERREEAMIPNTSRSGCTTQTPHR